MFNVISIIGVMSNACLIAFGSSNFENNFLSTLDPDMKLAIRILFVFAFENTILLIKYGISVLIPDVSGPVQESIERIRYQTALLNDEIPEAEDDPNATGKINDQRFLAPEIMESDVDADSMPIQESKIREKPNLEALISEVYEGNRFANQPTLPRKQTKSNI